MTARASSICNGDEANDGRWQGRGKKRIGWSVHQHDILKTPFSIITSHSTRRCHSEGCRDGALAVPENGAISPS